MHLPTVGEKSPCPVQRFCEICMQLCILHTVSLSTWWILISKKLFRRIILEPLIWFDFDLWQFKLLDRKFSWKPTFFRLNNRFLCKLILGRLKVYLRIAVKYTVYAHLALGRRITIHNGYYSRMKPRFWILLGTYSYNQQNPAAAVILNFACVKPSSQLKQGNFKQIPSNLSVPFNFNNNMNRFSFSCPYLD